jgi:hypothetical protein
MPFPLFLFRGGSLQVVENKTRVATSETHLMLRCPLLTSCHRQLLPYNTYTPNQAN